MKKKILGIFSVLIVLAMLTLPMSVVFAKDNPKFMEVSGEIISLGGATIELTPAGNSDNVKMIITGHSFQWTGSFEGISIADGRWILHKDHRSPWNIHTLQAEIDGKSGTLIIKIAGHNWRIISGTGDLANLHGQGTTWRIEGPVFGYEGQAHFDP
jgi:hypothetical protein